MKTLLISLDFELLWGVRDTRGNEYHSQLLNVHKVIPKLLVLFEKYGIACSWATVGALCVDSVDKFNLVKPDIIPSYDVENFSPYPFLNTVFELNDELLFAPSLIKKILASPKQELASHTFCHYYCLEQGQTITQFKEDLQANAKVADYYGVTFESLVFPRNQFNSDYLKVCSDEGLVCYRGNPEHWAYKAETREERSIFRRAFRLLDAYLPLSGSLRQQIKRDKLSGMINIPASLFLRPWNKRFYFLEFLRLWRIKWRQTLLSVVMIVAFLPLLFGALSDIEYDTDTSAGQILANYHHFVDPLMLLGSEKGADSYYSENMMTHIYLSDEWSVLLFGNSYAGHIGVMRESGDKGETDSDLGLINSINANGIIITASIYIFYLLLIWTVRNKDWQPIAIVALLSLALSFKETGLFTSHATSLLFLLFFYQVFSDSHIEHKRYSV